MAFVFKVISHHVAELFLVARVFVFDGGRGSVEYSAVCDCDVLFGCEVQKMRKRRDTEVTRADVRHCMTNVMDICGHNKIARQALTNTFSK